MLKAVMIGFGGIAQAHKAGYLALEKEGKVKLTAVCDIRKEAFVGKVEINLKNDAAEGGDFRCYTDFEEMLKNEERPDFIDICVPTFLHRDIAVSMLRKGYNVLCEKPMSLTYRDCLLMLEAEKESGKQLMIAQCLRFFPSYRYLKEVVDDGRFGKVQSAFFSRLSAPPLWSWENWYMDPARSGGCLTDMHIHDVDMVRYLFGEPEAVSCRAASSVCVNDSVQSDFYYGGIPVTAVGDWTLSGMTFQASYRVDLEKATVVYENDVVTVYPKDGKEAFCPAMEGPNGYTGEISYFCDVVSGKIRNDRNPASSAVRTVKLIEALRASVERNGERIAFAEENV